MAYIYYAYRRSQFMFVGQKLYKYVSSFRIYAACTINSKYAFFAVETSKNP